MNAEQVEQSCRHRISHTMQMEKEMVCLATVVFFFHLTFSFQLESPELSTSVNSVRNRRRSYGNLRRNLRQLFQLYPRLAKTMKR